MKAIALEKSPEYYQNYIRLAADKPLLEILDEGGITLFRKHLPTLEELGDKVYAEGKWTVKEMLQHLIDTERIFINRALRFVRNDPANLPGYDHNAYVPVARVDHLSVGRLLAEYEAQRKSSLFFFQSLNEEELLRTGTANNVEIPVVSIGYILVGHPTHHFNILKERYFPLI